MSDSDVELARRAIALLDLTDLTDDASVEGIDHLCERAARHGTAAVCVWPDFVAQSVAALSGTPVLVATVVNFPSGDDRPHAVRVLTERALDDGADEIDVVLPYRAWLAGDERRAADVIDGVRGVAAEARMKVILETGALARRRRDRACGAVRDRARRRLHQDVDRQDRDLGHARGSEDHAPRDRHEPTDRSGSNRPVASARSPTRRCTSRSPTTSWDPAGPRRPRSGSVPVACSTRSWPRSTGACSSRPIRRVTDSWLCCHRRSSGASATAASCRPPRSSSSSPVSSTAPCQKGKRRRWRWRSSSTG